MSWLVNNTKCFNFLKDLTFKVADRAQTTVGIAASSNQVPYYPFFKTNKDFKGRNQADSRNPWDLS